MNFLYPAHCPGCMTGALPSASRICSHCAQDLELLDSACHCPFCFDELSPDHGRSCNSLRVDYPLGGVGSACEYIGPIRSTLHAFKYHKQTYLAPGLAALMAAAWTQLPWPLPDIIIPVPADPWRTRARSFNPSQLLAQELAKLLNTPIATALQRTFGDFPQSVKTLEERRQLSHAQFFLKKNSHPFRKSFLLIDDVLTTGATLEACATVLKQAGARTVYALTLCRTFTTSL